MKTKNGNKLIFAGQDNLILDCLDEFLLALRAAQRSPRTIEFYEQNIGRFRWWLRKAGFSDTIQAIQASHIRLFIEYLQTKESRWQSDKPQARRKVSDSTVATYHRALRAFFNFCCDEGYIEDSPFADRRLRTPKVKQKVIPSYSQADIEAILHAIQSHEPGYILRDTAIVLLLLDTGIRAMELCALTLAAVERSRLLVSGKGNKERYVDVSPTTEKAIRDYVRKERPQANADALFLSRTSKGFSPNTLYQMIERRVRQAGLSAAGVHRFRHSFALHWAASGGPLHALQALLGHESPAMSLRYGRMAGVNTGELHRKHSPVEGLGLKPKKGKK